MNFDGNNKKIKSIFHNVKHESYINSIFLFKKIDKKTEYVILVYILKMGSEKFKSYFY